MISKVFKRLFGRNNKDVTKVIDAQSLKINGFEIGANFEKYVKDVMFDKSNYILLRETPSHERLSERFIEDCKNPDFTFRTKNYYSDVEINVEAKFRNIQNVKYDCSLQICSEKQLGIYKEADKYNRTFIALGIGTDPSKPNILLVIPVKFINSNIIHIPSYMKDFWFYKDKPIFPNYLLSLLNKKTKLT
ncbi:hypothetical protein [Ornithobacterium rhinotracheale]|uniref:hypothetical protein n=1 Tax=Ornithobacterium rhinotracheale TaxID=28251 RepID=UPI004036F272